MIKEGDKEIYKGRWWIPNTSKRVHGVLTIIPNKEIELQLEAHLEKSLKGPKTKYGYFKETEVIIGNTNCGRKITLFDCSILELNNEMIVYTELAIIGGHFNNKEQLKFKWINITLSNLDDWANINLISSKINKNREMTLNIAKRDHIKIKVKDSFNLYIDYGYNIPFLPETKKEICIKRQTIMSIETFKLINIGELMGIITNIRYFLMLATFNFVYLKQMKVFHKEEKNSEEELEIYSLSIMPDEVRDLGTGGMLFTLNDIKVKINEIMNNWFKKAEDFKVIFDTYSILLRNRATSYIIFFIMIVGIIEQLHRKTMRKLSLSEKKHEERVNFIIDSIPDEDKYKQYKDWIKEILYNYSNEKNLRTKLKELVKKSNDIFKLNSKKINSFVNEVVETRNYYVHLDDNKKHLATKELGLLKLGKRLESIFIVNILKELNFDNYLIENIREKGILGKIIKNVWRN